jgi:phosphoserine phosphatase
MKRLICIILLFIPLGAALAQAPNDKLASWLDGPSKRAIVEFVDRVTTTGSPSYVPPAERIAVFDNDGCLWAEKPFYFQGLFALDRVRQMAPQHPEWKTTQPFKAVLDNDMPALAAQGEHGLIELVMATHVGTTDDFSAQVREWLATAKHPKTGRPYTSMVYQPMLEMLAYLRFKGFKTYIVSGGGVEFIRVFSESAYGIPPEQVVGSVMKTRYEVRDGVPVLVRVPGIVLLDDKEAKPVAIQTFIGRRPVLAFGNSDGDFQMLEWTTAAKPSLGVYIHHDDAQREWDYDRASSVGKLNRGLDEAPARGWVVVSMKDDWKTVFPPMPETAKKSE